MQKITKETNKKTSRIVTGSRMEGPGVSEKKTKNLKTKKRTNERN